LDHCPNYVRYVGDRDTWTFRFGDKSKFFAEAFRYSGEPGPLEREKWKAFDDEMFVMLERGVVLCQYSEMINKSIVDRFAYETEMDGYKILVCNSPIFNSTLFGERINDYPFVAVYCDTGTKWKVSLYSTKMDVVEFAKKRGGGGHLRACGYDTEEVPF